MGTALLADALTGLAIPRNEPVVVLVVERRTGGYPDATTHAAMAPGEPSQLFEPVSMPIHATAGDYANVAPVPGDLGAALLMDLAGKTSWEDLASEAFGVKASIRLGAAGRGEKSQFPLGPDDDGPRVLGLVAFTKASWESLVRMGTHGLDRDADVATVADAIGTVRREALPGGDTEVAMMNMDLARIASTNLYAKAVDGSDKIVATRLPSLSRALAGREGGDLVSGTATLWLGRSGVLGLRPRVTDPDASLRRLLALVWDLQAAERAMDDLARTWQPSYGVGQRENAPEVAGAAIDAFAQASDRMLSQMEEGMGDDDDLPRIEAMLERLDAVRTALAERVLVLREDEAFAP